MARLRGNLHAHTLFSDGVKSPAELVAAYEALGYDFLAITDHDDWVTSDYWQALRSLSPGLLLFHGVEISYQSFPQHVGRVIGDRDTLHILNHPARYKLSVTETVESHYELIKQILQSYGVQMTRKEVREGLERLLTSESTESPDELLLRDVPRRNLHVA